VAPDLLFYPVSDEVEALAGVPDREVVRQGLLMGDHESPGRNESEREVASKTYEPGSLAHKRRAKAAWGAEI
jgi:hypothetical protein